MELIEVRNISNGLFFPQREFVLVENKQTVCKLMAMEIKEGSWLDLTVATNRKYQNKGYATAGLKMLIEWAMRNGYKKVTLTNLFGSKKVNRIAEELKFVKDKQNTWSKSITGPLEL